MIGGESQRVIPFSNAAKKALEEDGARRTTVRFQAQGDDMIPGKYHNADVALPSLCLEAAEQTLKELVGMLTAAELRRRDQAIQRAFHWMRSVAMPAGGIQGPAGNMPFYNDDPSPKNARIDIQVIRGRAFVNCPAMTR